MDQPDANSKTLNCRVLQSNPKNWALNSHVMSVYIATIDWPLFFVSLEIVCTRCILFGT